MLTIQFLLENEHGVQDFLLQNIGVESVRRETTSPDNLFNASHLLHSKALLLQPLHLASL